MKALVLPVDFSGTGSYRVVFPAQKLRETGGHDLRVPPSRLERREDGSKLLRFDPRIAEIALENECDFVWCQLVNDEVRLRQIIALKQLGMPILMDVDDWYGLVKMQTGKAFSRMHKGKVRTRNMTMTYDLLWEAIGAADVLTTTTESLAASYGQRNPNTVIVPNLLAWEMWEDVIPSYELDRPNGEVRLGWLGKLEWGRHDDALVIAGLIDQLLDKHPNLIFVAAGSVYTHGVMLGKDRAKERAAEGRLLTMPEVPFETHELWKMLDFDIGVAPLRASRFNEGKSRLKLLEYGAKGIPYVCSPTAEYQAEVEASGAGLVAGNPREWVRHLDRLITDHELRQEMGRRGRRRAAGETLGRQVWRWENVLDSLPSARRRSTRLLAAAIPA